MQNTASYAAACSGRVEVVDVHEAQPRHCRTGARHSRRSRGRSRRRRQSAGRDAACQQQAEKRAVAAAVVEHALPRELARERQRGPEPAAVAPGDEPDRGCGSAAARSGRHPPHPSNGHVVCRASASRRAAATAASVVARSLERLPAAPVAADIVAAAAGLRPRPLGIGGNGEERLGHRGGVAPGRERRVAVELHGHTAHGGGHDRASRRPAPRASSTPRPRRATPAPRRRPPGSSPADPSSGAPPDGPRPNRPRRRSRAGRRRSRNCRYPPPRLSSTASSPRARASAAARSTVSGSFSWLIRLDRMIRNLSAGKSRRRRSAARSEASAGRKRSVSTP